MEIRKCSENGHYFHATTLYRRNTIKKSYQTSSPQFSQTVIGEYIFWLHMCMTNNQNYYHTVTQNDPA